VKIQKNHSQQLDPAPPAINDCWNKIGVYGPNRNRCQQLISLLHCRNCRVYIEAGRVLLDRDLDEEYRQELTRVFSREKEQTPQDISSAFVFKAGREWMAISSELIEEIIVMGMIHILPHRSNRILRGIVNVRGKLELCFSIGGLLGIEKVVRTQSKKYRPPERLVVACHDGFRIVFPVTEVLGIVRFSVSLLQEVPVTVSHSRAAFTKGIIPYKQLDIGLLDEVVLFGELKKNLS
jgi:chemotaxis-related protein WspD